jgi:glucokinase
VPFTGARGCAGTLASSPTAVLCPVCGEVRESVLEEVASGPAIVSRYNKRAVRSASSAEEVLAAAARGNDEAADWTVNAAVQSLGSAIGLLVNVLDPDSVIVGGGLGSAQTVFWDRLPAIVRQHIWSDVHRALPILQASQGPNSGWIGAGLLALERLRVGQGTSIARCDFPNKRE